MSTSRAPDPGDQLVDIIDDAGRVIGTADRRTMRAGRLMHRAVFIAVRHPDDRILIHQRSPDKDLWPGRWDIAVGGVVGAGEAWDAAAVRELGEEVGVTGLPLGDLGGGTYRDDEVALVGRCYEVVTTGPFVFADGEVVRAEWVALDDLGELADERQFLPDSWALLLPLLLPGS